MALRTKTIEYGLTANTIALSSANNRVFPPITVYIPETTSRTFRSVIFETSVCDLGAVAASVTAINMGLQIGANPANTYTVTQTITNSGESQALVFTHEYTQYFKDFFTGNNQSITCNTTITGPITINSFGKLILTYEYEDSAATTRIKTVKIPVEGSNTALTTANVDIGGIASQIPNLSTFLPESTKVFRNIFFESFSHTGTTAAANSYLAIVYNGVDVQDSQLASTLISDMNYPRIDNITSIINTAATNTLQARTLSTTGRPHNNLSGVITVTYEYDHSASTSIINSIQLPLCEEDGVTGGISSTDKSRFVGSISIQEPGPISLVQSGVLCSYSGSGAVVIDFRAGAQPSRIYTHPATVRCGNLTHLRRIDSGATGGAGLTITRGENPITLDWWSPSTGAAGTIPTNFSALLYLNYTSGKDAQGDGAHNHTTQWCISNYRAGFAVANGVYAVISNTTPIIPEANYWATSFGYKIYCFINGTGTPSMGLVMTGQIQSTESMNSGAGWESLYSGIAETDSELGIIPMFARAKDSFKQYPQSLENKLNIQTTRKYRYETDITATATIGTFWQSQAMLTYHTITNNVSITLSNVPASSNVQYAAYRDSDGYLIGRGNTTSGSGTYTLPWYDNTANVVAVAYTSSLNSAVSYPQNTSSTFALDLSSGGSTGPTYYAYA